MHLLITHFVHIGIMTFCKKIKKKHNSTKESIFEIYNYSVSNYSLLYKIYIYKPWHLNIIFKIYYWCNFPVNVFTENEIDL